MSSNIRDELCHKFKISPQDKVFQHECVGFGFGPNISIEDRLLIVNTMLNEHIINVRPLKPGHHVFIINHDETRRIRHNILPNIIPEALSNIIWDYCSQPCPLESPKPTKFLLWEYLSARSGRDHQNILNDSNGYDYNFNNNRYSSATKEWFRSRVPQNLIASNGIQFFRITWTKRIQQSSSESPSQSSCQSSRESLNLFRNVGILSVVVFGISYCAYKHGVFKKIYHK